MITLQNLNSIYFSCDLPEPLEMQASLDEVQLTIQRSSTDVISVTLATTDDGYAYFYDIRSVIEEELQAI